MVLFEKLVKSIKDNKISVFQNLYSQLTHQYDIRPTDQKTEVFNGFTCFHYCCYFDNAEIAAIIIGEMFTATQNTEPVVIEAIGIEVDVDYEIAPLSSCLQIALLRKAIKCIYFIFNYLHTNYQYADHLYGIHNQNDQTHLFLASLCSYPEAKMAFSNKQILEKELIYSLCGLNNIVASSVLMENFELSKQIFSYYRLPKVKEQIYNILLLQNSQLESLIQLLQNQHNDQQTLTDEQQQIQLILKRILTDAYYYYQQSENIYTPQLQILQDHKMLLLIPQ